ncbi:hypothetical protein AB4Z38_08935 [Arthrobacter sp. 2RAF6]|uniref:hypothetical protein n=1 Tax=Arthrobacter sp. 2RAF6 TaxID=3233002 RepID=UPI003F8DF206
MLLSHYGDWHSVLNKFPHTPGRPGEGDEGYTARMNRLVDELWARLRAAGARGAGIADCQRI